MRQLTGPDRRLPAARKSPHLPACLFAFFLICLGSLPACAGPSFAYEIPQMLPAGYYQCYETTPKDLLYAYFGTYAQRWLSDMMYNNQPFVLKKIEVDREMLRCKGEDFIWVDQIKCVAVSPGEVSKLKNGQVIDVVGLNRGVPNEAEMRFSLLMTECYFLPAGLLALPLTGGATFASGY